ncbi:unnamed protein product [Discosporangium mesarthrocarpum]
MTDFSLYYLQELKYRIAYVMLGCILCFITIYTYKQSLIFLLLPTGLSHFVSSHVTEVFTSYYQLSIYVSSKIGISLSLIQIYNFLKPGLYLYEAKFYRNILINIGIIYLFFLFIGGPYLIQISWELFYPYHDNFNSIQLSLDLKLTDYLNNIKELSSIFIYTIPIIVIMLLYIKKTTKLIKYRKIIYLTSAIISALISPPDISSQFFILIPLLCIYEINILSFFFKKIYGNQLKANNIPTVSNKKANDNGKKHFQPNSIN